jgi:hypothetical protein
MTTVTNEKSLLNEAQQVIDKAKAASRPMTLALPRHAQTGACSCPRAVKATRGLRRFVACGPVIPDPRASWLDVPRLRRLSASKQLPHLV